MLPAGELRPAFLSGPEGTALCVIRGMLKNIRWPHQYFCQHQFMRRFAAGRMWLECSSCGHETVGMRVRGVERDADESRARAIGITDHLVTVARQ